MIEMALSHVNDPDLGRSLTELGMIENIAVDGNNVSFDLVLTTPACPMKKRMTDDCINAIHEYVDAEAKVTVNLTSRQQEQPDPHDLVPGVKNVIAVASGKGGVGKSTVAVNLAIKLMSIGFLVDSDRALAWRGPMASGALKQLATETWWGEIDYLVVDMPPGTGDVQLTLAQTLPVTGAIIVSTPQQVALADVVRGVELFRNPGLNIPVLGFVENMAWFTPAELPDHKYYIFGREGCSRLAAEMNIPLLAQIPLVQSIADSGDSGRPVSLWSDKETEESKAFMQLAENTIREICKVQNK